MQLESLRELALRAARSGAALVHAAAEPGTSLDTTSKGRGDYVTSVDRSAEEAIVAVLREGSPDIPVVAEEAGGTPGALSWSVDPLDGTANVNRGLPLVGVSVGLVEEGWPIAGAVAAPFPRREWHTARGLGAHDESRSCRSRGWQGAS